MAPTLYMIHASPPVRAVLMTAKAIGLEIKEKNVDFFNGEHLSPEFLKINPQHTIPTLVDDDGFVIWDSHAIMTYLVSKYAKNDALYPQDPKKRTIVNQRLHFNSGVIFFHMRNIAKEVFYYLRTKIDENEKKGAIEAYDFLETFLDSNNWAAGDFVSIADYSLVATVTSLNGVVPLDPNKYPNILAWVRRCEDLPEYEANRRGLKEATQLFRTRLSK